VFWIGLLIASIAGVISTDLSRDAIKHKWPSVQNWHLDVACLALLVVGLFISLLEYRSSESDRASLERRLRQIRSFEVTIRAHVAATWAAGNAPTLMPVIIDESRPIATLDLRTTATESRRLELVPTAAPAISPANGSTAELTLRARARPGDWIFESTADELLGTTRVEFGAWGLTRSLTRDGRVQILAVELEIFVNGSRLAQTQKESRTWIELPQDPNRYGSLSWEEFQQFRAGLRR
jgi:hypothetical protein